MRRPDPTQRVGLGQGLVEFALVLPLVLLLIFGVVDLGRAVYAYNTVAEAARQANRTAIVNQTEATVKDAAIGAAPALNLQASNVTVCYKTSSTAQTDCTNPGTDDCPASLQLGCLAFVTTTATYQALTPVIGGIVGTIQLSSTSVGSIEYVCPTATHPACP
jgi:Flp pilus assembly protein TadG